MGFQAEEYGTVVRPAFYNPPVGFGHLYVAADRDRVAAALERHLVAAGLARLEMTPDRHPKRMKEVHEASLRLFWISPRLSGWTGIFEFRYYANEMRERWGYTDEELALALSKELGEVWRMEVLDGAGFWLYARYVDGKEAEGRAYQDTAADRTPDRAHPRYELNRIIEREGFANIGLGYENIPGDPVCAIENVPQDAEGIEGLEGFVHLAFEKIQESGIRNQGDAGEAPAPD